MSTTVDSTTDKKPIGRPRRNLADQVRDLHEMGLTRPEIAVRLRVKDTCRGGLARALQRAGEHELLAAITPPGWGDARRRDGYVAWRERAAA